MSTDADWEAWGQRDPYFGVLTQEQYRLANLTPEAREAFFATGQGHVDAVLAACRRFFHPEFAPRRVLDFGCGVGRMLLPFARIAEQVVGVDVSPAMLAEARRNCERQAMGHVELRKSDDTLTALHGEFDLVHSAITLQHIEAARGRLIFRRLVQCVAPYGGGVIHVTYGKARHAENFGQPPPATMPGSAVPGSQRLRALLPRKPPAGGRGSDDPRMLMTAYHLSELAYILQSERVERFNAEFTDHGGELGLILFFQRSFATAPPTVA